MIRKALSIPLQKFFSKGFLKPLKAVRLSTLLAHCPSQSIMKIIFFCPPVSVINGGIKHIFRMAECLRALGYNAFVFEQNQQRPSWFVSTAPIVGQGIFQPDANQVYVLPEDQPNILANFKEFPQRKVIYSQNHFYGALGIEKANSYSDYGITHILCSSKTIYDHCQKRHPSLKSYVIPCAVDGTLYKPSPFKSKAIAFMPRKRAIEAVYIRDMFRFYYPQHQDWEWLEISNLTESDVASTMARSKVFLSLSRLEGFGLTPLEAMASGCVVAGFTGIGGQEYANNQNGFWANEDDFPTCISQLNKAILLSQSSATDLILYQDACAKALTLYTRQTFQHAIKTAWQDILSI